MNFFFFLRQRKEQQRGLSVAAAKAVSTTAALWFPFSANSLNSSLILSRTVASATITTMRVNIVVASAAASAFINDNSNIRSQREKLHYLQISNFKIDDRQSQRRGQRYVSITTLFQSQKESDEILVERSTSTKPVEVYGSDAVRSQRPTATTSTTLQMLSFYHFEPLVDTPTIRDDLFDALASNIPGIRGTIYVANEGINAQLAVPSDHLDQLVSVIVSTLPFDPFKHTSNNGPNLGDVVPTNTPTFERLIVRTRDYILRDGISSTSISDKKGSADDGNCSNSTLFDWTDSGPELSPEKWHEELTAAAAAAQRKDGQTTGDEGIIMLDCRNKYESDDGIFEGAVPLNTNTFQESWQKLDELTERTMRDRPVYIYCTGGIRCVKTGAYLKQKLGFKDVRRLEKGIIGYEKWIEEHPEKQASSVWKGKNFLFDKRRFEEQEDDDDTLSMKSSASSS